MIKLYHDKQKTEADRFKWHAYTEDLEDIKGYEKIEYDGIIPVKFVDFKSINKNWLDGDHPDTMILENKDIKLYIKNDSKKLRLFVEFPNTAKCIWH